MTTYTVELHTLEAMATGGVTAVTGIKALDFTREHNNTTESSVTLPAGHPLLSLPDPYGKVVQIKLNGVAKHAFLVEKRKRVKHDPTPANRRGTWAGRDLYACLERGRVHPTLGYDRKPWAASRALSFASRQYSPGITWTTATVIVAHQSDPSARWGGLPDGQPAADIAWIGPSSGTDNAAPSGYCYLIGDFTLDADSILIGFPAADNQATVYFDAFDIANISAGDDTTKGFRTVTPFVVFASAGPHRIGVKLVNLVPGGADPGFGAGPSLAGNPTGFIFSMYKTDESGRLGDRVLVSDAAWQILEYPSGPPPGVNIGWAAGILLDEWQADGLLPYVTRGFSNTVDKNGNSWNDVESITLNVDDSQVAVSKSWADGGLCDFNMPADQTRWDLYRPGERGSASGVSYLVGTTRLNTNLAKLEFDGEHVGTDCLSVTWAGGNFRYPASGGTVMRPLKTNCKTRSEAEALAVKVLASPDIEQVLLDINPIGDSDTPLVGPNEADTVATHNIGSGTVTEKLVSVNAHAVDKGLAWKIGLRDVRLGDTERLQREIQRAAGGTGGGTLPSSPVDPPPKFAAKGTASEITFHFQGDVAIGISEVRKKLSASANLFKIKLALPSADINDLGVVIPLVTTADVNVNVWMGQSDGSDAVVASGTIPAGSTEAYIYFVPTVWMTGGVTEIWPEVTATAVEAHDLLFAPSVL